MLCFICIYICYVDIKYNSGIVQDQECVDEIDDEIDDHEDVDDEEDDDDDEDEGLLIFEKRATLYTKSNDGTKWIQIALGTLAIYYDSNILSEKIILKADGSGEMLSNTIISMTTEMQVIFINEYWNDAEKKCFEIVVNRFII